jgi:phosphomannomutase
MTDTGRRPAAADWIAHDPDPATVAELQGCSADELAERFARPLSFGTAGLRGPLRGGPNGMNVAVVLRASWALAAVLKDRGLSGSTVVVGRDARHGSQEFAAAAAEVLAAEGYSVTLLPGTVPTPVLAFAVRYLDAAAGIQITASHNPPSDNGYKVYTEGGMQIISPTDRAIEAAIAVAPHADEIARQPVAPSGADLIERYLERAGHIRHTQAAVRVALTPLHGVGGEIAVAALQRAGLSDVHTVAAQFDPDPDFPTVAFPNPEEPGAVDALLELAAAVDADIAIALDPDADRCAVGLPTPNGWRMLSGDETGWLLGDYILSHSAPGAVVASTLVSSGMLAAIAAAHGAHHVETLTGFKWLARADAGVPGGALVYAYEEAIGHCVDPAAVRDKDGITAAVLACDLVAALAAGGRAALDALDDLARRHGLHVTAAVSTHVGDAAAVMTRLRDALPTRLAGVDVTTTDLLELRGPGTLPAADALIFAGDDDETSVRMVVRPSGTEPKIKCYIEVRVPVGSDLVDGDLAAARSRANARADALGAAAAELLQRGPNWRSPASPSPGTM